ncbi:MAG: hypothetical protein GWN67_02585 [Phycisphaerae bacterium]|nr:hypothetical protein [Phycisphaerae bacterium]NIP52082.1 hypothetical protein [Phycisphaerae bacterium]NIS50047.1 hypothetical protein [Phycisphaerae bacterium]NIU10302.1 hypothetical protein [Phycisphaerae bacterium]NIU55313.1 hypothetical protein [Phycisphaerae bacterium]
MEQNVKKTVNGANKLVSRLAAEKKKTVTAVCLIALMILMWARVLGKKSPETADASQRQENVNQDGSGSNVELNVSFIELPKIPGRNDVLTRDFFAANGWRNFNREQENYGNKEVSVFSEDGNEDIVRRVAQRLRVEAIVKDGNPQAFINGKLLSVGDKFLVRNGGVKYECEVVGIEENVVVIKCGQAEIKLKVMKAVEVTE